MNNTQKSLVCIFFMVTLAICLTSCSYRLGDFTIISTKNYNMALKYKEVGRYDGMDLVFVLFGIPFGKPNIENAVDEAIQKGNGVYLANAVLEVIGTFFHQGYKITGDVYAEARESDLSDPNVELFKFQVVDGKPTLMSKKRKVSVDF